MIKDLRLKLMKGLTLAGVASVILFLTLAAAPEILRADRIDELKAVIDKKTEQIKRLEQEIKQYEKRIQEAGSEAKTLEEALSAMELIRKKLLADLEITQNKVSQTSLELDKLSREVENKENQIASGLSAVSESLRDLHEREQNSLLETLLAYDNLSRYFDELATLEQFQFSIAAKVRELVTLKSELEAEKQETTAKKNQLVRLQGELGDRKKIVEENQKQKNVLLTATKNKEVNFKKMVVERQTLREAFEKELFEFEKELSFEIDARKVAKPGSGVLSWPLDSVFITQYFGDTDFSRQYSHLYNGKGHNGIDLRASPGTPVKAAAAGRVIGAGNTDLACPGISYGRWILVEHPNGLSTLYAHLSQVSSIIGQSVERGEVIGWSGWSGYATGPHLHFTVYATQGVRLMERMSIICGTKYLIPLADFKAYLNPMLYL